MRYAKKFSYCLFTDDFSVINGFSDCKRGHVLNALSALSKYLGVYNKFQGLVKAYGLKWKRQNSEMLILDRIEKTRKNGNIIDWIKKVKEKYPSLTDFLEFILVSGLRFTEAVHSYNLIVELTKKSEINNYYNCEKQFLEHYKFKQIFIRRTKKAFVSYIPKKLIHKIGKNKKISSYQIGNWFSRNRELKSRFSDIREYWATFMTKYLNLAEIDFLQGRVSASVFMRNYFNPELIDDLKERVFKGISKIRKIP